MMKRNLLIILLSTLLLSVSCELFYPENESSIRLITVASDYVGTSITSHLECCPVDQSAVKDQIEYLAKASSRDYDGIHITLDDGILYRTRSSSQAGSSVDYSVDPYSGSGGKPMREQIFSAIEEMKTIASNDDITIFYYSGHGAEGTETEWLERGALVFDLNSKDAVFTDELIAAIESIPGKKALIIDACYSGMYVEDPPYYPSTTEEAFKSLLYIPAEDEMSTWSISASGYDEKSWSNMMGRSFSLFTNEMLKHLGYDTNAKKPGMPNTKDVSILSIYSYAQEYVDPSFQTPQSTNTMKDLVLFSF